MNVRFTHESKEDFKAAVDYYNGQQIGLGFSFSSEVEGSIERIKSHPYAWPKSIKNTRKCRVNNFPFNVVYRTESKSDIMIFAIMHMSRRPGILINRV